MLRGLGNVRVSWPRHFCAAVLCIPKYRLSLEAMTVAARKFQMYGQRQPVVITRI